MNFKYLLAGVMGFFITVLIVCYILARQANPVFLDSTTGLEGRPAVAARSSY